MFAQVLQAKFVDIALLSGVVLLALSVTGTLSLWCTRLGGKFAEAVRPQGQKLPTVEGLRGVLALAVVAHHASCWYGFTTTGRWAQGSGLIFLRLGVFGVLQFFYISGFLFWRKLMKGSIDLLPFYQSRFIRIGPVYYVCVGMAICVATYAAGSGLHAPVGQIAGALATWATFAIVGQPSINGGDVSLVLSGVVWTLGLEWLFYLSLPLFGWFSRKALRLIPFFLTMLALLVATRFVYVLLGHSAISGTVKDVLHGYALAMMTGFGGGILLATLDEPIRRFKLSDNAKNWLLVACYGTFLLAPDFEAFLVISQLCLFVGFALVLQGASLFGALTSRPVRFLGLISYDLYLVHGMVYYVAMLLRGGVGPIPVGLYMAETAGCIVVIVLLSAAIHFAIERPSMARSEAIARRALHPVRPVEA